MSSRIKVALAGAKHGVAHVTTELAEALALPGLDAVILCTPTQMHARQALACLEAGKHVQVEIPLCDILSEGEAVVEQAARSGKVAMCGHTRRFNPSHQWVRRRIRDGGFRIQQMDVQTCFFRRTNTNALGQPRSWTDHLLWHHAAHTVDLFDGKDQRIDVSGVAVSMNGIELQDREFFAAIREGREPEAGVAQVLPCYQVLDGLERQLAVS